MKEGGDISRMPAQEILNYVIREQIDSCNAKGPSEEGPV